jgi:hypothetical protein
LNSISLPSSGSNINSHLDLPHHRHRSSDIEAQVENESDRVLDVTSQLSRVDGTKEIPLPATTGKKKSKGKKSADKKRDKSTQEEEVSEITEKSIGDDVKVLDDDEDICSSPKSLMRQSNQIPTKVYSTTNEHVDPTILIPVIIVSEISKLLNIQFQHPQSIHDGIYFGAFGRWWTWGGFNLVSQATNLEEGEKEERNDTEKEEEGKVLERLGRCVIGMEEKKVPGEEKEGESEAQGECEKRFREMEI